MTSSAATRTVVTHSRPPYARRCGRRVVGNAMTRRLRRGKKKSGTAPAEQGEAAEAIADYTAEDAEAPTDALETTDAAESDAKPAPAPVEAAPAAAKAEVTDSQHSPRARFGAWLGRPMTSFHLIVAITALLTTLGLTMVLSASGVRSYGDDGSAWVIFGKQVLWTVIGVFGAYFAMRVPRRQD